MCVCVGAMKKFTSVSSFCSELRSIATITATMLPVSPFTEFRGVWECVCEQWLHPHTPTHTLIWPPIHSHSGIQCACSMANTMLERRAKFQRKLHAMRMCNSRVRPRPHCPLPPLFFLSYLPPPFIFWIFLHLYNPLLFPQKTARYKWLISLFPVSLHKNVSVCVTFI